MSGVKAIKFYPARVNLKNERKSLARSWRTSVTSSIIDMSWYDAWLSQQIKDLPYAVMELRVVGGSLRTKTTLNNIFTAIEEFTQKSEGVSIDDIAKHLEKVKIFNSADELGAQRLLIFAVLGWRSMLYQAAFNVCLIQELAIHQYCDLPQSGLVFDTYRVPASLSDRPLSVLLKAFGNILPARSSTAEQAASENSKAASSWLPLYPTETNAYLLHVLLRIHIKWVDALALHLDYDKSSRTLSIFSYPSFCLKTLLSGGVIYSFASIESYGVDPRANKDDISQLLREVLLSYRLLFGQSARSRRLFRQIFKPPEKPGYQIDLLLLLLCTRKQLPCLSAHIPIDRPVYFSARDFSVLSERIDLIAKELKDARPNSIGDLIRDRRDTLQFWTFWLVSIIGGTSILLSLIQVILQAVQLMKS